MCARSWYFDDNAVGLHSSISDNEKQSNLTRQRIFPTSLNTKHGQCSYWEFPYINMFVGYLSVITNLRKTNSNLCFVIYFALIWNVNLTSAIFRGLYSVLHSFLKMTENVKKLTETRDSITRIPQMTGAKEGTLSVGTIGVSMAVVFKVTIIIRYLFGETLVHIWKKRIENWIIFQYR